MARVKFILTFFVTIILMSCATTHFVVEVDAYGSDNYLKKRKYIIVSGDSALNENNLQYIEFSDYIREILDDKGYVEAENLDDANLMIFFRYGISDPKTFQQTYSVPVWGQTGISSINTTGYSMGSAYGSATGVGNTVYGSAYGSSYGNSTTKVNYNYGVTGYRQETATYTTYFRYLILDVYDLNAYRKQGKPKMVWNTKVTSSGSSGDLRLVIPYMLAASSSYFGKNSNTKQTLKIQENYIRVKQLKGIE